MTILQYDTNDIRSWADFSGDINPVHFDPAIAKAMGQPDVPVHGMRVMLDLKAILYRQLKSDQPTSADRGSLAFKATLRSPVLRGRPYELATERRNTGVSFALSDHATAEKCLTGYFRHARSQPADSHTFVVPGQDQSLSSFDISRQSLIEALPDFRAMTNDTSHLWLLIDALLFRHLIDSRDWLLTQVSQDIGMTDIQTVNDLMRHTIVLQTQHLTVISPEAQHLTPQDLSANPAIDALHCRIESPLSTGNATQTSLTASLNGTPLVSTTVDLMILPFDSLSKIKEA